MEAMIQYKEITDTMKQIYNWMEDDLSKELYRVRSSMVLSDTYNHQLTPYMSEDCKKVINERIAIERGTFILSCAFSGNDPFIFYGTGIGAKHLYDTYCGNNPYIKDRLFNGREIYFCDKRYLEVPEFLGYKVISPEQLVSDFSHGQVMICTQNYENEVCEFLEEHGFTKERILHGSLFVDVKGQYFDPEIISCRDDEVFVDAGVFNGETSVLFSQYCKQKYEKIYLFEPNEASRTLTKENLALEKIQNYELFSCGLWDKKETLFFGGDDGIGSFGVDGVGEKVAVEVDTLDHMLGDTRVTFIKMDIEGAELNALQGAKNIIEKYRPKLAISIYHKAEDIFELPLYIKSLVPEYKFYLRHYSTHTMETVLYAVIET